MTLEHEMMRGNTETGLDFRVYLSERQWVAEVSRDGMLLKEMPFDCSQTPCLGIHSDDRARAKELIGEMCRAIEQGVEPIGPVNPFEGAMQELQARLEKLPTKSVHFTMNQEPRELARGAGGEVVGFLSATVWSFQLEVVLRDGSLIRIIDRGEGILMAAAYVEGRVCHA